MQMRKYDAYDTKTKIIYTYMKNKTADVNGNRLKYLQEKK